jgi:hypothetical protein
MDWLYMDWLYTGQVPQRPITTLGPAALWHTVHGTVMLGHGMLERSRARSITYYVMLGRSRGAASRSIT